MSASQFELSAELRSDLGKGASRRLRRENKVPAILYGAEKPPLSLAFNHYQVLKALENEAFYSHILTIAVQGEKESEKHQAILKDLQRHPFKPKIMHMDFLRINPKEKITVQVPLHFVGEAQAPGVKQSGIIIHLMSSVEIRCLPADLPEYIDVDVSQLELEQSIHLSELALPKGVELVALMHGGVAEHDTAVVKIQVPRAAEETVAAAPSEAAAEKKAKAPEDKK